MPLLHSRRIPLATNLALCWLLFSSAGEAAITRHNTSSSESSPATSLTISYAHTVHASSNAAVVLVCERDSDSSGFTSDAAVTVGGVSATLIARSGSPDDLMRALLFRLLSPSTGSTTVSVTGDTGSDRLTVAVVDYEGVQGFGTATTAGNNSSSDVDVDGIASASGEVGVMGGCARSSAVTVSADATAPTSTELIDTTHTDVVSIRMFLYEEAGATTSINMRADLSVAERWAAVGVSMSPATATLIRRRGVIWLP